MERSIDKLTGLFAGIELNSEMETLIAKGDDFALVALDIDNLLVLNRDYGREAGDEIFRLISKHIRNIFPESCLGFRGTGDAFEILMPNSGKELAFLKAEELRKIICETNLEYVSADGKPIRQTISIGVSSYPEDGSRPADIIRRADSALVRAKKNGRNIVCLAREEKLMPKTSHYTQAQLEKLAFISETINVSEAALLREALDVLIKKYDIDEILKEGKALN
jgi:diguanylate cyclase (GGDEF)-like protein